MTFVPGMSSPSLASPRRFLPAARLQLLLAVLLPLASPSILHAATPVPLVVRVNDWAAMPFSGNVSTSAGNPAYMARVNFMRPEPGGSGRIWVCDLNGNLYIFSPGGTAATRSASLLDQARNRTAYLDFNGESATADASEKTYVPNAAGTAVSAAAPNGLFQLFTKKEGYANGLVTFQFDPGYATNGKFYTIHIESVPDTNLQESETLRKPVTTKFPGLNTAGYTSTPRISPPTNSATRQAVLIEWTDTNRANTTFEGTAREILRIGYNQKIHPLGDITFNPTAQPGSPEWGVMYLAGGDGGSGESNSSKASPQRLDSMVGKILRIIPDLTLRTGDSSVSPNGRYRIPNENPFTNTATYGSGVRKEIWTLGHRNPHRFTWHLPDEPGGPADLLVEEIGLNAWEEVNIIRRGKNYGYSNREGPQQLTISSGSPVLSSPPASDTLPIKKDSLTNAPGEFTPVYPVITYPHTSAWGDAITNGFFYKGTAIPALQGKFVFGDITTGRVFCSKWEDMLAADDGVASTTAEVQPVTFLWDDPNDSPDAGLQYYDRFFGIVEEGYDFRGGVDSDLPGSATIAGAGRADIRLAVDAAGELYITSKSDGVIRSLGTVFVTQPVNRFVNTGVDTSFTASATAETTPSYQWQRQAPGADWVNLSNDATFTGVTTTTLNLHAPGYTYNASRFRCVATCTSGSQAFSIAALLDLRSIPDAWLSTYFNASEKADVAISGDLADPDHDGLVNLLEYAFGFDPETDSSPSMPVIERVGSNVRLVFPVPRAATMNYTVEKSTDLQNWSSSGITLSTAAGKTTATLPLSSGLQAFLRIQVAPK